jgi:D-aminopeptidase
MRVVLSADMEGIGQMGDVREIIAGCREYWETGRPRMNTEVAAPPRACSPEARPR